MLEPHHILIAVAATLICVAMLVAYAIDIED
jgi:hypothetical protein